MNCETDSGLPKQDPISYNQPNCPFFYDDVEDDEPQFSGKQGCLDRNSKVGRKLCTMRKRLVNYDTAYKQKSADAFSSRPSSYAQLMRRTLDDQKAISMDRWSHIHPCGGEVNSLDDAHSRLLVD
jgi:hypothetical protein